MPNSATAAANCVSGEASYALFPSSVVAAHADAGEIDAALALLLDQIGQSVGVGDADVEVAVGGEDDAVVAVRQEVIGRDLVGQLDSVAARGGTAGLEVGERGEDSIL